MPGLNKLFSFPLILIVAGYASSCKQQASTKTVLKESISKSDTYFSKKPDRYYYDYDTSISEMANYDRGYVDTFSIGQTKFQLRSNPDSLGDLELQVMKNGSWQTNLKLPYGTNGNDADTDMNKDGFNDFVNSLLRGSEVYFFDPTTREFVKEAVGFAFEWAIIDSAQNLYANHYASHDYYATDLFTLNGFQQVYYYYAPMEYQHDGEWMNLRLYKVANNDLDDTSLVFTRRIGLIKSDFDYVKFWKEIVSRSGSLKSSTK